MAELFHIHLHKGANHASSISSAKRLLAQIDQNHRDEPKIESYHAAIVEPDTAKDCTVSVLV